MNLTQAHIEDLKPRYVKNYEGEVVDTHGLIPVKVDGDIDELNAQYHNHVISHLWGDWIIEYALSLQRINYGR